MSPENTNIESSEELTFPPERALKRARWAEVVFIISLIVYAILAFFAHRYAYFAWDVALAERIQAISSSAFNNLMVWVSLLGAGWIATSLVVAAGLGLIAARFRIEGILCMAGAGLGSLMNTLFKAVIGRPRPAEPLVNVTAVFHHESFPSGHVTFVTEFFGFLLFLAYVLLKRGYMRAAALVLLGLEVALVGVSRVYLGAHWPSDVVGAYLSGGVWLMLMIEVYRRLKAHQSHRASPNPTNAK